MPSDSTPDRPGSPAVSPGRVAAEVAIACVGGVLLRVALQPLLQGSFPYLGLYVAGIVLLLRRGLLPTLVMLALAFAATEWTGPRWLQTPEFWHDHRVQRWSTVAVSLALMLPLVEALRRSRERLRQAREAAARLAEQRLRQERDVALADRRLATIVRQANDAIVACLPDGRVVAWNPAAERLFGYSAEEAMGQSLAILASPEQRDEQESIVSEVKAGRTVTTRTLRRHRDGHLLQVRLSVAPMLDDAGRLTGMSAVVQDLGEQLRAEEALRASEATLRAFYDNAPVCMGVVELVGDDDMRHLYDNPVTCELFGVPPGATAGRLSSELGSAPETRRAWAHHYRESLAHGQARFDYVIGEGAGQRRMSATVCPVAGGTPERQRFCYVSEDVTEQRLAEQQLREADRQKDEFLAILAHELRNPLAPLVASVQLLRRQGHDAPARERSLAMMDRQLSHMVRMVDDLLDVSRITQGRLELSLAPVPLAVVVDDAAETSRPLIEQQGHHLERAVDGRLVVKADATRLAQVLSNLLNNAAKYTPPAGQLRLVAQRVGPNAQISVIDNGIGIPPDQLDHVFDLFAQVTGTAERAMGGLGIGLSIARQIVQLHDGRLEAFSDGPGRGSRFTVTLPLAEVPEDVPSPSAPLPGSALSILVADDNVDAAQSLAELLRLDGHGVQVVHDGAQAVQAARTQRPDVVLLDIGMPVMDGLQAAARIRADGGPGPLLVAVSGWGQHDDLARSAAVGFDRHLTKPVRLDDLRAVLTSRRGASSTSTPTSTSTST